MLAPPAPKQAAVKEGWTRIGARPQKSHAAALMSDTPATCTLLLGIFAFFVVIRVKRWTGDTVGASAESIEGRQYWRLLTSNCAHVDATHFVFNLSTAYSLGGALERRHGSAALLLSTSALVVFVGLVAACVEINQCVGCVPAMASRCLRRAVRNRHHHAIEQVSRRWREGRRVEIFRTKAP